jgi:hypothetical protein
LKRLQVVGIEGVFRSNYFQYFILL